MMEEDMFGGDEEMQELMEKVIDNAEDMTVVIFVDAKTYTIARFELDMTDFMSSMMDTIMDEMLEGEDLSAWGDVDMDEFLVVKTTKTVIDFSNVNKATEIEFPSVG
ncbi:MAG: hypothetical protein ACOX3W_06960 [Christensenellaceae bacterium]